MMAAYLLDTNHLGHAIRPVSPLRDRIRSAHRHGARFGTYVPALCELQVGILRTSNPARAGRSLRNLDDVLRIWPLDLEVVPLYAELYTEMRRRGRSLSPIDLLLAALAMRMKVTLLTTDRDFEAVTELTRENWLTTTP